MIFGTYQVSQGASLDVPFLVTVNGRPGDLTNARFKSTLKTDITLPDTDPTVIMIDWQEGSNPTSGLSTWSIPADTTQDMTVAKWQGLIRVENVPGLPAVYDLLGATVIVTQPVSSRF